MQVALAILQKCEKHLLMMADMEDIVHFLKAEVQSAACAVMQLMIMLLPLLSAAIVLP